MSTPTTRTVRVKHTVEGETLVGKQGGLSVIEASRSDGEGGWILWTEHGTVIFDATEFVEVLILA